MDLHERQIKIEQEYSNQGILKAMEQWERDQAEGRLADTNVGRTLTLRMYKLLVQAIEDVCSAGTRGVGGRYRTLIKEVGTTTCSIIVLRAALGLIGRRRSNRGGNGMTYGEPLAQDLISLVSQAVELEHMLAKLQLAAPGYMHRVVTSLDESRTKSQNHRKRTFAASANNVQVGAENVLWPTSEREGVGRLLLEACVDAGIIELATIPKSKGQNWVAIRASAVVEEHLERMGSSIRAFTFYPPMLVPPKPHDTTTLFRGASYLTDGMANVTSTVKLRTRRKDHMTWIKNNIGEGVIAAANKAATQPYVVDVETATLLRDLYQTGVHNGVVGIPSNNPIVAPEYPLEENWNREDEGLQEIHMGWKAIARQAYGDELKRKAQVLEFNQTLRYLREYSGDILYFPTYFDWRGRLYFRSRINPQSTDFVKAVLQFGNKKALGKRGVYWLKVHVATCYGFDKKGMDTRAIWTDTNMELIREAVTNHIDSDFFRGADSPWCFYVAARELVRALDSGSPETWESGVPVAMDATCSGMQHLSALLRDPVGGMFTNLLPNNGDEKEDIYAAVAAVAVSLMQKDTENLAMAQYWLDAGVPRSAAKRPVMTYVYGGTLMSCTDYVFVDMQERGLEGLPEFSAFKLAAYLSKYLRKGIESTVPSAAAAMRFLRELAGKSVSAEAMQWVTPTGFPVIQQYAQEEVIRLNLPAVGVKLNMMRFDDSKLNRAKCVNGIAPNFVHSLDSAHLVRVINAFEGSIVPIHDSFATHACNVDGMHVVLRSEFVTMYADSDPLQALIAAVESDDKPDLPPRGSLEIQRVLASEFFMC
jgi:DNA-directed RNA polymerase